jgi:hypothetical protein
MDPVTAFSLAGTVLQFIDSASRFVGLAWRLYRSGQDSAADVAELDVITKNLSNVLDGIPSSCSQQAPEGSGYQKDGLLKLAGDCKKVASQLIDVLQSVKLSKNPRKRDAVKTAFKLIWKEDEIKALHSRLDVFRSQFNLHLLISIRLVIIHFKSLASVVATRMIQSL